MLRNLGYCPFKQDLNFILSIVIDDNIIIESTLSTKCCFFCVRSKPAHTILEVPKQLSCSLLLILMYQEGSKEEVLLGIDAGSILDAECEASVSKLGGEPVSYPKLYDCVLSVTNYFRMFSILRYG